MRESDLVAVALTPGPAWPGVLRAAWGAGAAVFPLDPRLPRAEIDRLLAAARPTMIVDEHGSARSPAGTPVAAGIALAMATSGTTGEPKIALIGHDALRHAVVASLDRLGAGAEGWVCCLPVAHMGGMLVVARALAGGAEPAFCDPTPEALGGSPGRYVSVVPTVLARCRDAQVDLARFAAILSGGDALGAGLRAPNVVETYGMTESCGGVVYDGVPLNGVDVRIEGDEILLGGPTLMHGYLGQPRLRGWLRTGDAGELVDGRLRVLGRLDERITTGGEKVYPTEVEHVLRAHPAVAEALVRGEPDPEWGTRVVALVVARDQDAPPTAEALREHVRARLAPSKVPAEVRVVDALPRARTGTTRRRPGA